MKKTDKKVTKKQAVVAILKSVHPEMNLTDEETLFEQILSDYEAYAEVLDREAERAASERTLESEYSHNMAASMAEIEVMRAERDIAPEEIDVCIEQLKEIATDISNGNYSVSYIEQMLKANRHEADMAQARAEGEIAGRNARIEERLSKPDDSDGQPMLNGANNGIRGRRDSIFDIARAV